MPIFLLISSTTVINNNGLTALPCLRPAFTLDSPDSHGLHNTLLFVSSYVPSTTLTSVCHPHPTAISSCPSSFLSTSCLGANIPSIVPLPFLNLCCSSSISHSTSSLSLPSRILTSKFNVWFSKAMPLRFPMSLFLFSIFNLVICRVLCTCN